MADETKKFEIELTRDEWFVLRYVITYGTKCCVSCGADLSNGPTAAVKPEPYAHLLCMGCRR